MALALIAARQAILVHWGTPTVPDHMAWLHRLWMTLAMERLSLVQNQKSEKYAELWAPFITLLSKDLREVTCPKFLQVLRLIPSTAE